MKSNAIYNAELVVQGAQQSGTFTIAANGKAFKILIDGLYSNKIQAIIRELSSNAFDAQVAANRGTKPFELYLPNMLDPIFAVRDFGTSLAHDDIMGLYTTVFQSTKEDTNLAVGKFGLGSKTPFAYTDSFTVTAFMRGTKRVYGAYIDVTGIPMISLMASEDTNEPDGLMVSFPVKDVDCERFRVEAERVVKGFDVKPEVKGATIDTSEPEVLFVGSNFKIHKTDILGNYRTKIYAKQGCVIYPIETANIPKPWDSATINIGNTNIIIDFPIGQLDITPSRETLSYDDATIKNIVTMFGIVDQELRSEFSKKYETEVKTMFQARCFYQEFRNEPIPSIRSYIETLKFNGKPVRYHQSMSRDRMKKNYNINLVHFDEYYFRHTSKTMKFGNIKYDINWEVSKNTTFIYENVFKDKAVMHANARIRNNFKEGNIIWIRDYGASEKQLRSFKKLLGYPPKFYNLNELLLPERKKVEQSVDRIAKTECHVEYLNDRGYGIKHVVDLETLDPATRYVVAYDDWYLVEADKKDGATVSRLSKYFEDTKSLVIVRRQHAHKFEKAGFTNALTELRDKLYKEVDFDKYFQYKNRNVRNNHWLASHAEEFAGMTYEQETSFKKLVDFMKSKAKNETLEENFNRAELWRDLTDTAVSQTKFKEHETTVSVGDKLDTIISDLFLEYPLLTYLIENHYNWEEKTAKDVLAFVELVDKVKELENKG